MRQLCWRLSTPVILLAGLVACGDRNDRSTNQVAGYTAGAPAISLSVNVQPRSNGMRMVSKKPGLA